MPLNPPSYLGQDVWYSPSVYVNQVPVALWQPAVPQPSALHSLPVIPSPKYELTQQQIALATSDQNTLYHITDANGNTTYVPKGTPGATAEGTAPSPDSLPGQMNGPTATQVDAAAAGQGGYAAFIGNMNKVLSEARGGAWRGGETNPNIQQMLSTTGISSSSVFKHNPEHSYWCAAFAGWMLKISGLKYTVGAKSGYCSAGARDYINFGQSIDTKDPHKWRQGDVAVVASEGNTSSGSHVTFLWSYPGGGWYKCLGGNQGNTPGDVCLAGYQIGSFKYIGRAWDDPGRELPSSPSK